MDHRGAHVALRQHTPSILTILPNGCQDHGGLRTCYGGAGARATPPEACRQPACLSRVGALPPALVLELVLLHPAIERRAVQAEDLHDRGGLIIDRQNASAAPSGGRCRNGGANSRGSGPIILDTPLMAHRNETPPPPGLPGEPGGAKLIAPHSAACRDAAMLCERRGKAEMYRMHAVAHCPECGFENDCCGW